MNIRALAVAALFAHTLVFLPAQAFAQKFEQHGELMGQDLSVSQDSHETPSNLGVETATYLQFVGSPKSLVDASIEAIPADGTVLARTDWYIGGVRVWNGSLRTENGGVVYSGGVAPTQIPFPIFVYPVGPVVLELDAGVEFEGNLAASLMPVISDPIQNSNLAAKLEANASIAGYVEGYAKTLLLRAGIGGRVHFVDGKTGVTAAIYLSQQKPKLGGFGKVQLLSGRVYGFVDSNLVFGTWKRWIDKDFFHWEGKCFAFGVEKCEP